MTAQSVAGHQLDSGVLWSAHTAPCVCNSPTDASAVGAVSQAQLTALLHTYDVDEDHTGTGRNLKQPSLTVNTCNLTGY